MVTIEKFNLSVGAVVSMFRILSIIWNFSGILDSEGFIQSTLNIIYELAPSLLLVFGTQLQNKYFIIPWILSCSYHIVMLLYYTRVMISQAIYEKGERLYFWQYYVAIFLTVMIAFIPGLLDTMAILYFIELHHRTLQNPK